MSEPHEQPDGLPCVLSEEVSQLLMDPALSTEVFSAIVATIVTINETRGLVPGSTASVKWPEQRRMALGAGGSLGVLEYVIAEHADPPQIVVTRIQLYSE
ncbi:hypothetical protein [Streptomyces sp. NPDC086023]|uniref:hypothetical protein n=1 Tax=Streptomyces sp. NPDC086023 TaxID=3365746 RepID=UPI0037CEFCCA